MIVLVSPSQHWRRPVTKEGTWAAADGPINTPAGWEEVEIAKRARQEENEELGEYGSSPLFDADTGNVSTTFIIATSHRTRDHPSASLGMVVGTAIPSRNP